MAENHGSNARPGKCILCSNSRSNCDLTFFSFPADGRRKQEWESILGVKNKSKQCDLICQQHFQDKFILKRNAKPEYQSQSRLTSNAVPNDPKMPRNDRIHSEQVSACSTQKQDPVSPTQMMTSQQSRNHVSCDTCSAQFSNGRDLDLHLREVHDDIRPFLCHLCPAKFKSPHDLEHHVDSCQGINAAKVSIVSKPTVKPNVVPGVSNATMVQLSNRGQMTFNTTASTKVIKVNNGQIVKHLLNQGTKAIVSREMLDKLIANGKIVTQSQSGKLTQHDASRKTVANLLKNRCDVSSSGTFTTTLNSSLQFSKPVSIAGQIRVPNLAGTRLISPSTIPTSSMTMVGQKGATLPHGLGAPGPLGLGAPGPLGLGAPLAQGPASGGPLQPFSCSSDPCNKKFTSIIELTSHITHNHSGSSVGCDLCDMKFPDIGHLEEHVTSFVCPVDAAGKWKGFGSMPSLPSGSINILDPHLNHQDGLQLPTLSDLPGLKFARESALSETPFDEKQIMFSESDEEIDSHRLNPQALRDQIRQNKRHVCNVCGKSYQTLNEFTKHYKKHAGTSLMPPPVEIRPLLKYPCNICSKSFACFEELYNHRKVHTGETPYACRYCDQAYVDVVGLEHHMFGRHAGCMNSIKLIRCRVMKFNVKSHRSCYGRFFDVKSLRQHCVISHQTMTELPCGCERCGRLFSGPEHLEEHIEVSPDCDIRAKITEWLSETPEACRTPARTPVNRGVTFPPKQQASLPPKQYASSSHVKIRNSKETRGRPRVLRVRLDRNTKCPRCRKRFESLSFLRRHYNSRCEGRRVTPITYRNGPTKGRHCDSCDLFFWSEDSYTKHMVLHQEGIEETNVKKHKKLCSLCLEEFDDMNVFFEHYKSHGVKYLGSAGSSGGQMNLTLTTAATLSKKGETFKPMEVKGDTSKPMEVKRETSKPMEVKGETSKPMEVKGETFKPMEVKRKRSVPVSSKCETSRPVEGKSTSSALVEMESTGPTPVRLEPTDPTPVKLEYVGSEPMELEATCSAPVKLEPTGPAPVEPKPMDPTSVEPESTSPAMVEPESTSSHQTEPEPADSEPYNKRLKLIWHESEKSDEAKSDETQRTLKFTKLCSVCNRTFTNINDFIEHYRMHGDERQAGYVCGQCPSRFISKQAFLNHCKIHTGETPYTCKFCNEAVADETSLGLHIPAAHYKTKFFRLSQPRTATSAAKIKTLTSIYEMKLTLGERNVSKWSCKCLECYKIFKNYKTLKVHILSQECAVTFRPVILESKNLVEPTWLCKVCGNLYRTHAALGTHMKSKHILS